jgi:hypothetical protein
VLALVVIPRAKWTHTLLEANNISAQVSTTSATVNVGVHLSQGINPFKNKFFPLIFVENSKTLQRWHRCTHGSL